MSNQNIQRIAAYVVFAGALLAALSLHGTAALLAGLLAYVLTRSLLGWLKKYPLPRFLLSHEAVAAFLVGFWSLVALGAVGIGVARLLGGESVHDLLMTVSETLQQSKQFLPEDMAASLPDSVIAIKELASEGLKSHAGVVAGISTQALHGIVLMLVGWIVGVLAAVSTVEKSLEPQETEPLFSRTWLALWDRLAAAFAHVAFAQCKIAALNAAMTGIFLLVVCPLLGWNLPYAKTLVLVTFLCSLIPVVGNLVSNTAICTLALGVSMTAALTALAFLVIVHKLEYFMNARIQGHEIGAKAWELLIILFGFEIVFGPVGMAAAPVFYAFVKNELRYHRWLPA